MADTVPMVAILPEAFSPYSSGLDELDSRFEVQIFGWEVGHDLRMARDSDTVTPELAATEPPVPGDLRAALAESQAMFALDLPSNIVELAPKLRWVQGFGAGVGHMLPRVLADAGIVLTNASGVAGPTMAEFVMCRLLEVWKNIRAIEAQQRDHTWQGQFGEEVGGKTLGIIGLGAIGREVATRARAFGMTVIGTRRSAGAGDTDPDVDELAPAAALDEVLGRCDAVVVATPSTPETEDLFDAGRFAAMKQGAVFCNVGRGNLVVEPDLVDALSSGHLRAAVLDVTRVEPNPPDSPLWDAPNLYLSPHCSVALATYGGRLMELIADNMDRFATGRELRNVCDPDLGYPAA